MPTEKNPSLRLLSDIVHWDKYAKYLPELKRRETHEETTARTEAMHQKKYAEYGVADEIHEAFQYVGSEWVLPSMRSFQFAGLPVELNPARIYNCSATHINSPEAFAEGMFLLLSGCGFGYSVQKHHVRELPPVLAPDRVNRRRFLVADSIEGWADAVLVLLNSYFKGAREIKFDFRDIRKKGALLVTSGGRAPGAEPLKRCLEHITKVLDRAVGRQLTTVEAHDVMCFIADAVLSGGIRRAAMIALFEIDDESMIKSKSDFTVVQTKKVKQLVNIPGQSEYDIWYIDPCTKETRERRVTFWGEYDAEAERKLLEEQKLIWWKVEPQRGRANNSAVIVRDRLTWERFGKFFEMIMNNGSGEPGIMFTDDPNWLVNPCGEASIRPPGMFCNLSTINADGVIDQHDLNMRARMAARIGVLQAGYTDFHYLRPFWKDLSEADAQLGVSITGIASGDIDHLDWAEASLHATDEAHTFAPRLGINLAARITLIKPEGTTSLKLMTSSGCHDWFAPYYWRRFGLTKGGLLYNYFIERLPELVEQSVADPTGNSYFLKLPIKAPDGAKVVGDTPLKDFLNRIERLQREWIAPGHHRGVNSHNVSATAYVHNDEEWAHLRQWIWDLRHKITGLSVLPVDDNTYVQAPYEECTQEEYEVAAQYIESREFDLREIVEEMDNTDRQGELACSGPNGCEVL